MRICFLIICLAVAAGPVGAGAHGDITTRSAPAENSAERFLRSRELASNYSEEKDPSEVESVAIALEDEAKRIKDWLIIKELSDGLEGPNPGKTFIDSEKLVSKWSEYLKDYNKEYLQNTLHIMLQVYFNEDGSTQIFDFAKSTNKDTSHQLLKYLLQVKHPSDVAVLMKLDALEKLDDKVRLTDLIRLYVEAYSIYFPDKMTSLLGSLQRYDDKKVVDLLFALMDNPRRGATFTAPVLKDLTQKWLFANTNPIEAEHLLSLRKLKDDKDTAAKVCLQV